MKYKPVIGLEIHIQVKTKTKMFSAVSADYFGKQPNSNVDPVTLGLPGALPVPNQKAIEQAIRLSMALGCKINADTKFDRKNYFYPDLPKGYQISQYDQPIGYEGWVILNTSKGEKKIRITRVHLEEDTGKSIHEGDYTYIDFNKAGVPLIEVVTEPDFEDGEQIDIFAKTLRQIVRFLDVSNADMEKGQMRYELNISLARPDQIGLPKYKVEVKNIGSISLLQKVLEFEQSRQSEILDQGCLPVQETRGTRDMSGKTISQRVKEDSQDYRYFPEPDIPPLHFGEDYLSKLKASIPALPAEVYSKYIKLGFSEELARIITSSVGRMKLLSEISVNLIADDVLIEIAKLISGDLSTIKLQHKMLWADFVKFRDSFVKLAELKISGKINSTNSKILLEAIISENITDADGVVSFVNSKDLMISEDSATEVTDFVRAEIAKDPSLKGRYLKNPNTAMFLVGSVMKQFKGKVDPLKAKTIVENELKNA